MAEEFNENMENENPNIEEKQAPVRQNKIKQFFQKYPQVPTVIGVFLLVFIIICSGVYFAYFHQSSMNYYAEEFCACALEPAADVDYEESIDNFDYLASMNTCFAGGFKEYAEGMTVYEKKAYLLEFRDEVLKACPHKLDYVFKYE